MNLDETICSVMNGGLEYDAISAYCRNMYVTKESFHELKNAIESYDLLELYTVLFNRFNGLLTKQDAQYFADKCRRVFNETVCEFLLCEAESIVDD